MKYLIYPLRIELSNKPTAIINLTVTVLVTYFILQFFGAYRGTMSNEANKNAYYIASAEVHENIKQEDYKKLCDITGFAYAMLSCGNIGNNEAATEICGFIGTPSDKAMFSGTPIEQNNNLNTVYIPYSRIDALGKNVGEELILKRSKETGIVFLANETESEKDFEFLSFIVAGTFGDGMGASLIFPLKAVLEHFTPLHIQMYFDSAALSESDYKLMLEQVKSVFGDVTNLTDFDTAFAEKLNTRKTEAALYFMLGMICIVFMYSYILSKRIKRFSVCCFCGASKQDIAIIIILDCLFTYFISFGFALLLGRILDLLIFNPLTGYNTFDLNPDSCIQLFLITLIIYIIIIAVFVVKFIKNTAVNIYRRNE